MATTISKKEVLGIIHHLENLEDPRSHINRRHLLIDVIVISICGVLAGADGPTAIEEWAKTQHTWLKKHLKLPYGIPSHDCIGRVLESLQPQAFQECFAAWLEEFLCDDRNGDDLDGHDNKSKSESKHIAIDGKTLRRSHDRRHGLGPLHLVSAWATKQGISLGQLATEEKSNEITAIPELLKQLDLNNTVITIDAMGCQKEIAETIIRGGGHYVLALKGNQETLHEFVSDYFVEQMVNNFSGVPVSRWEEQETRHGRVEHRTYYQVSVPDDLPGREKWPGLKTIGVAIRNTESHGDEVRFYICSMRRHGQRFARLVRGHWGIENTLHWSLDMTFREDESRVRARRLADNLAWLRRIVLTLLKQHPGKQSLVMKRRLAGWDIGFLMEVLTGKTT